MSTITNNKSQITNNKPLRVLFVASGNKAVGRCSSFVQSQFDSLVTEGLDMRLYPIVGHGVWAHLKVVRNLRKTIKNFKPNIVHAHYSICGYVAWLACLGLNDHPKIVVSILGSFPKRNKKWQLVRYCIQHLWDVTLVKSERTRAQLGLDLPIIPNGVNLEVFHPMDKTICRKSVGWNVEKKYIIWCSNPARPEKNWLLAQEAINIANVSKKPQIELVSVYNKTPQEVAIYMNAADCLLLTSDKEGSPNVIKEAMACNCPIVTTNVGDVTERLQGLEGCYIVEDGDCRFTDRKKAAVLVAKQVKNALDYGKRNQGNRRIIDDGLTIEQTAKKIIKLYESI